MSRELTGAVTLDQVLETVIRNVGEMFDRDAVILLPEGERLVVTSIHPRVRDE